MLTGRSHYLDSVDFDAVFYRARVQVAVAPAETPHSELEWDACPSRVLFITCSVETLEGTDVEQPWFTMISSDESPSSVGMIRLCVRDIVAPAFFHDSLLFQLPFVRAFRCYPHQEAETECLDSSHSLFIRFITVHDFTNVRQWVVDYVLLGSPEAPVSDSPTNDDSLPDDATLTEETETPAPPPSEPLSSALLSESSLSNSNATSATLSLTASTSAGSVSTYSESVFSRTSGQSYRTTSQNSRKWSPRECFQFLKDINVTRPWAIPHWMEKTVGGTANEIVNVKVMVSNTVTKMDQLLFPPQLKELDSFFAVDRSNGLDQLIHAINDDDTELFPTLLFPNRNKNSTIRMKAASAVFVESVIRRVHSMDVNNRGRFDETFDGVLTKILGEDRTRIYDNNAKVKLIDGIYIQEARQESIEKVILKLCVEDSFRRLWDSNEMEKQLLFALIYGQPFSSFVEIIDSRNGEVREALKSVGRRHFVPIEKPLLQIQKSFSIKTLNLDRIGIALTEEEEEGEEEEEIGFYDSLIEVEFLSFPLWRRVEMYRAKKKLADEGWKVMRLKKSKAKELYDLLEEQQQNQEEEVNQEEIDHLKALIQAYKRYWGLFNCNESSVYFELEKEPNAEELIFMEEFALSPKRSEVFQLLVQQALMLKIPAGTALNLPIHLAISKSTGEGLFSSTAVGRTVGHVVSSLFPIAQRLFHRPQSAFGWAHVALTIGNCKFEYLADSLVRFGLLSLESRDDGFRELIASPVRCSMNVMTRRSLPQYCLTLAKAFVRYNSMSRYMMVWGNETNRGVNCQMYALQTLRDELGCSSHENGFPDFMMDFIWKATKVAMTVKAEARSDADLDDVIEAAMVFEGMTQEYAGLFGQDPDVPSKIYFRKHSRLDRFVSELNQKCLDSSLSLSFREACPREYEYLQALDRAFWMHDFRLWMKGEAVLRDESCPFVLGRGETEEVLEQLKLPFPRREKALATTDDDDTDDDEEGGGERSDCEEDSEDDDDDALDALLADDETDDDDDDDDDLDALLADSDEDD